MGKKVQIFDKDVIGNEKLQKLHPMAIPLLAVKLKDNPRNTFLSSSVAVITESPFKLTDKWIDSINKWVESVIVATMLEEPELKINQRYNFGPIKISKIQEPNYTTDFPMPAIICQDDNGWKFYFKTTKAYDFQIGNKICFSALVASHKEGITFLSRPTKIVIWTEPENE